MAALWHHLPMTKLTVPEACVYLGNINRRTLYERLRIHHVEVTKERGRLQITTEELDRIKNHKLNKKTIHTTELAHILDRLTMLEQKVAYLVQYAGEKGAGPPRPQEAALFRKLVDDIIQSQDLLHKHDVLRTYLERLPAPKALEVFPDPSLLVQAYYQTITYLAERQLYVELDPLLRLRGKIEVIAALIPRPASLTDAERKCPDGGTAG